MGSRGKSLKLTTDKKSAIAVKGTIEITQKYVIIHLCNWYKNIYVTIDRIFLLFHHKSEIERYEQALANFRGSANVSRKDGLAETEERALKLGEIEKTRETFQKGLLTTITYVDGKKMRDRARVCIWQK